MIHCYQRTREEGNWLYTVGYWAPKPRSDDMQEWYWVPLEDTSNEEEARALVNYLNGGDGRPYPYRRGS